MAEPDLGRERAEEALPAPASDRLTVYGALAFAFLGSVILGAGTYSDDVTDWIVFRGGGESVKAIVAACHLLAVVCLFGGALAVTIWGTARAHRSPEFAPSAQARRRALALVLVGALAQLAPASVLIAELVGRAVIFGTGLRLEHAGLWTMVMPLLAYVVHVTRALRASRASTPP